MQFATLNFPSTVTHPHELLDCTDAADFIDALHNALCSVDDWAGHGVSGVLYSSNLPPRTILNLCKTACARAWLIALEHARQTNRVVPDWMHDAFAADMLA